MTTTKRSAIEWAAEGVKLLLPIAMIGWYAHDAIQRIEAKAAAAVERVAASVQKLETAQALATQRQDFTEQRLGRVERRQDDLESALSTYGVQAVSVDERRRRRSSP